MNIAIFGGSFDPPHIAHEKIVHKVLKKVDDIDRLIIVPTYLNPFKEEYHLSPKQRYKLVKKLFKEEKNISVSSFEINQNEAVPSIKTVKHFKKLYKTKKIYLIIGSDNLETLHLWHKFEKLKSLVEFIVISREGYEVKNDIIQFINIKMKIDISSTSLKENLRLEYIPKKIKHKVNKIWKKELKK